MRNYEQFPALGGKTKTYGKKMCIVRLWRRLLMQLEILCERGEGDAGGMETSKTGIQQKLAKIDASEKQSVCVLKHGKYS